MKNALIAFDKFKDAITALEACRIADEALAAAQPNWARATAPLADGGDGFCHTLTSLSDGIFNRCCVRGPLGAETIAVYGLVDSDRIETRAKDLLQLPASAKRVAIIEFAQSSGIALVPQGQRSPWTTTSYGLGQAILDAQAHGADAALIGLGGSATHDLALGALQALGYEFADSQGALISDAPVPEVWERIAMIAPPQNGFALPVRVACDVENPLLGPRGAAAVFGPQKGLKTEDLHRLDRETARLAALLCHASGSDPRTMETAGSGAAGGAAFGLMNGVNGILIAGAPLVFAWSGLEGKLVRADVVITGEGRFDATSLSGKGPGLLAQQALAAGKDLRIFAGSIGELPSAEVADRAIAISPPGIDLKDALADTALNLGRAIRAAFSHT